MTEPLDDRGGVRRLGHARAVRGGRRQRADRGSERARSGVVRDPEADRRCAAGERRRKRDVGPLRDDERQAAGPEPCREPGGRRRPLADLGGLRGVGEEQHDPPIRRPVLRREQRPDPARRGERDGDSVDGVRRDGDDPAGPEHLDGLAAASFVVRNDPRGHAADPTADRRAECSAARSAAAWVASAGDASTRRSMSCAAPSSPTGGAT